MSSLLTSLLFLAAAGLGTGKECDQTTSTDTEGFGCEKFVLHPWQCVDRTYDDDDFTALDACCACEDSSPARDRIRHLSAMEPTAATTTPPTAAPTSPEIAKIMGRTSIDFLFDGTCDEAHADLAEAICNTTKDKLAEKMTPGNADAVRKTTICELDACARRLSRRLSSSFTLGNEYVFEVSPDDQAAASASADEALGPNASDADMLAFQAALGDALAATGMTINVTAVERSEAATVTIVIVTTTPETPPSTPSATPSATTTGTSDTPAETTQGSGDEGGDGGVDNDGAFEARSNFACGAVLALLVHIVY